MAFDFLGTYTEPQLQELESFINAQILETDLQANHFVAEANRYRKIKINLEKSLINMNGLTVENKLSFYRTERELDGKNYKKKTYTNNLFEKTFLRGDSGAPNVLDDFDIGTLVTKLKKPYLAEIKEHEKLEKKIRQCEDHIEQLEEMRMIKIYAKTQSLALLKAIKEMQTIIDNQVTSFDLST